MCGLWSTRKHLFAVLLDDDGRPRPPIKAAFTRDACAALFAWLAAAALDAFVLSDRSGPLVELARAVKLRVYLAPHDLIEAIRAAAGYTHRPPRDTATLLARWYLAPALRRYLRASRRGRRTGRNGPGSLILRWTSRASDQAFSIASPH